MLSKEPLKFLGHPFRIGILYGKLGGGLLLLFLSSYRYFSPGAVPVSVHLSVLWVPCLWIFFALQVSFQPASGQQPSARLSAVLLLLAI